MTDLAYALILYAFGILEPLVNQQVSLSHGEESLWPKTNLRPDENRSEQLDQA